MPHTYAIVCATLMRNGKKGGAHVLQHHSPSPHFAASIAARSAKMTCKRHKTPTNIGAHSLPVRVCRFRLQYVRTDMYAIMWLDGLVADDSAPLCYYMYELYIVCQSSVGAQLAVDIDDDDRSAGAAAATGHCSTTTTHTHHQR